MNESSGLWKVLFFEKENWLNDRKEKKNKWKYYIFFIIQSIDAGIDVIFHKN